MISNETGATLNIASDKLVSGAYYSIVATAKTDSKNISQEINIQVSLNAPGSIEFSPIFGTVNNDNPYLIAPQITDGENMNFL